MGVTTKATGCRISVQIRKSTKEPEIAGFRGHTALTLGNKPIFISNLEAHRTGSRMGPEPGGRRGSRSLNGPFPQRFPQGSVHPRALLLRGLRAQTARIRPENPRAGGEATRRSRGRLSKPPECAALER